MQFITNGPDVPERLIRAHEDGRVVFFCGAGTSFPAGLPGFKGLVDRLYEAVGENQTALEHSAIKKYQYDTAIGLLEKRLGENHGNRLVVREHLRQILSWRKPKAPNTQTHEALLRLSRTRGREPRCRLVTTNFDRLFETVREPELPVFQAPCLPPAKTRWHGLVYLHGLLPTETAGAHSAATLDQVVLSSGDFGLAYLTEGWAARFVAELFRRFTVCFVGYSVNDPVLRYMLDALAADQLLGEKNLPEAFAFASHSLRKKEEVEEEWRAKNLTPILYREYRKHFYLHRTLREWSEIYRDGVLGKERAVVQYATYRPVESTSQDDFVGRVIWALSDPSGTPARRFAELEDPPPLEWLEFLADRRFGRQDLINFGIFPEAVADKEIAFSLFDRPADASRTTRIEAFQSICGWDEVIKQLARWLVRHLDDPKLLLWAANRGRALHPEMLHLITCKLDQEPPRLPLNKLWRLLLAGRVRTSWRENFSFHGWRERVEKDGLTLPARLELREVLKPRLEFSVSSRSTVFPRAPDEAPEIRDLVDWTVVLGADHIGYLLRGFDKTLPPARLATLLPDLTAVLREAFDVMRELDGATDVKDPSAFWHPSISEHGQNKHYREWTYLIDLARDAWLAMAATNAQRALLEIRNWLAVPYPVFKRLAFFAARDDRVATPQQALQWLLTDDCRWLWSSETLREAVRLMITIAPKLAEGDAVALQAAILRGSQRFYPDDIDDETLRRFTEHDIWLRLVKLEAAGVQLGQDADIRLQELSDKPPKWRLAHDERDEFQSWSGGDEDGRQEIITPKRRGDLVKWLRQHPGTVGAWQEDDWQERCKTDYATTAMALCKLAHDGEWITERWYQALQAWCVEPLAKNAFRRLGHLISTAPDETLKDMAHPVSRWLEAVAKHVGGNQQPFFTLATRTIALRRDDDPDIEHDPVSAAINNPTGNVVQALFPWWHAQGLEDEQGIGDPLRQIFDDVCDLGKPSLRHGRVILAQHAVTLFRVDPAWTNQYVVPLFDWSRSRDEARAAWCGFLWTPRPYLPLLGELKPHLLMSADHYDDLGKFGENYAALLTLAALDPRDWITRKEIAVAFQKLPEDGLVYGLRFAAGALRDSVEQRTEYWDHRVKPFIQTAWPKTAKVFSERVCAEFVKLCAASGEAFPDAVATVVPWLQPKHDNSHVALHSLMEADLCAQFPAEALSLLHAVVNPQQARIVASNYLRECLNAIIFARSTLARDPRMTYLRGD